MRAATEPGWIPNLWQLAVGFLGGGGSLAIINHLFSRRQAAAESRRSEAEADSISVETANFLLTAMRGDLADMRARLLDMDRRVSHAEMVVRAYRQRVEYLTDLLQRNNVHVEDWSGPS